MNRPGRKCRLTHKQIKSTKSPAARARRPVGGEVVTGEVSIKTFLEQFNPKIKSLKQKTSPVSNTPAQLLQRGTLINIDEISLIYELKMRTILFPPTSCGLFILLLLLIIMMFTN